MEFTIKQIAQLIGGEVKGNENLKIHNFAKIEEGVPGSISFLANPKYEAYLYSTESSAVIVSNDFVPKKDTKSTLISVPDPYLSISQLMAEYQKLSKQRKIGREEFVKVAENAIIGDNTYLGSFSYISEGVTVEIGSQIYPNSFLGKNVKIGKNTIIYAGVKIYDECVIGDNCIIHSGAVIGADGFGFAPDEHGIFQDIPQLGNVVVNDNVSIGANCTIDRATMGSTLIGKGTKLDNSVQIGHNVEIGQNTIIASQTGVAGSTKIGNNCMIGGQVGFAGHLKIADGTKIGAQSGVGKNIIQENQTLAGRPLLPLKQHLKLLVNLRKLSVQQ
jgi:UDP-3-O-[3-hydroxymyristoyl] glucosamine N-acyltransferase